MRWILIATLLFLPASSAGASGHWQGVAARHNSLAHVAALRGMDPRGTLFASPLVPLGTRLCVDSPINAAPICGVVVDVPQPYDRAWQIREGRFIEVQPWIARRLCPDPTGRPRDCPVTITRG